MSTRPNRVRPRDIVSVIISNERKNYIIRRIEDKLVYMSESYTSSGRSFITTSDGITWSVYGLQTPHTVEFYPSTDKCYLSNWFLSDKVEYADLVEEVIADLSQQHNACLTRTNNWDTAQLIWKPTPDNLSIPDLPSLDYMNNLFTTAKTLTRKDTLLSSGLRVYGQKFFDLHPFTYLSGTPALPADYPLGSSAWIVKPVASFGGSGIKMFWGSQPTPRKDQLVQKYVESPLLYDGRKFDLRVHLLLTPTQMLMHRFVFGRVVPEKFISGNADVHRNITNLTLHLSKGDVLSSDMLAELGITFDLLRTFIGKLRPLLEYAQVEERKYQETNGVLFKTFEMIGLDITFYSDRRPWLLEINKNPTFPYKNPKFVQVLGSSGKNYLRDTLNMGMFFDIGEKTTTDYVDIPVLKTFIVHGTFHQLKYTRIRELLYDWIEMDINNINTDQVDLLFAFRDITPTGAITFNKRVFAIHATLKNYINENKKNLTNKKLLYQNLGGKYMAKTMDISEVRDVSVPVIIRPIGSTAWEGYGIKVAQNYADIEVYRKTILPEFETAIVSDYILHPLLYNPETGEVSETIRPGFRKFHLRIYLIIATATNRKPFQSVICRTVMKILTAGKDYNLDDLTDKEVHDTHAKTTPYNMLYPEDFHITPEQDRQLHAQLDDLETMFGNVMRDKAAPYPDSTYGYEIFGCDMMIDSVDNQLRLALLEINSNIGLSVRPLRNASDTRHLDYGNRFFDWTTRIAIIDSI